MVKILLSGCCGKMGTVISNLVSEFPSLEIIAGIDKFPMGVNIPAFLQPLVKHIRSQVEDQVKVNNDSEGE